jgi:hypothetical protein
MTYSIEQLPARNLIRKYICNKLLNKTISGNQVFNTLVLRRQLRETELPCINILTANEREKESYSSFPRVSLAQSSVEIYGILPLTERKEIGDDLDFFMHQIHQEIDPFLGGLVNECTFSAYEFQIELEGQIPLIIGKNTYQIEYLMEAGGQIPNLDDLPELTKLYTKWDMYSPNKNSFPGMDGQIDAEDRIASVNPA